MRKEIKKKWLKALRSGEYKQGKSRLKTGDTFCCLGVLCDLYSKENPTAVWSGERFIGENINELGILPRILVNWAGLCYKNPVCVDPNNNNYSTTLSELNDYGEHDFNSIADVIENQF